MDRRVGPEGPEDAKIMLIGEAPGEKEQQEGRPFVGQAGRILDGILEEVGIEREKIYITNVVKSRPQGNQFEKVDATELQQAYRELENEIMVVRPNVMVLCGAEAMKAVLGHKGIMHYRGSVLQTKYNIKCVPVIHPAAIGRQWGYRPVSVLDMVKVKKESEYPQIRTKQRTLVVSYDFDTVMAHLKTVLEHDKVAFDIETETDQINCISFAVSDIEAISVPFWFHASGSLWSEEQEKQIWDVIAKILGGKIKKIAQNAQYDITFLEHRYGIKVNNLWLDTMIGFHALYPELPKNLGFLCSIYTDVSYYKYMVKSNVMEEFFKYNATDACVTYECAERIYEELNETKIEHFYREHMHSLIRPLMEISRVGVRIDTKKKREAIQEYKDTIQKLQEGINKGVGYHLNVSSHRQMVKWLYEERKLPTMFRLRKKKGKKTLSADAEVLEKLYGTTGDEVLGMILKLRHYQKILSTYLEVKYDKEEEVYLKEDPKTGQVLESKRVTGERARTAYLITGTETGRLSSRETVFGTGTNLQNVPKGIAREIFIPDDGMVFINADLSQAEARVVAYLSGESRLISIFSSGGDIHRRNAANIFHKSEAEVTEKERTLAKRIVHASNYGMGPVTFAKQCGISTSQSKELLNIYFAQYPRIKLWHLQISSMLKKTRTLTTPFGRKRTFFNRYDESLRKEAYAYIPQSTVADLLNLGLRRFYEKTKGTRTQILLQIHDAILCQTPRTQVQETCRSIKEVLTIPIYIEGKELVIPVDVSVGENWNDLRKVQ